jgi:cobalt-zinc-cadmium efflux system outer membrane protein
VDRTQGRLDAGTAARLDLLKAQVDAHQAANDLIVAERDVVTARAGLNRLMGRPLDAGLLVADSLAVPPPVPSTAVLIAAALAHRPELVSLTQQQRGARAATTLATEFWLPDVTIGIGRDFADPGPGVLMTGISLPIPIFYFQHAKGEIAEAKWHEHELAATERDLRAAIAEEVLTLATATDAATRQARFLADQMLPAAREAYRIAASSYALGGSSALDVLDARRSLLDAEDQFTAALLEANQTRTDLERAVAAPLTTLGAGVSDDR